MYDDDDEETSNENRVRYGAPYSNMPTRIDETHNGKQGHYTGRCGYCGSSNLWDDNHAYGCNDCGRFWIGSC